MGSSDPPVHLSLLIFDLGGHRFALRVASVREVAGSVPLAPLPDAPDVVEGALDYRGAVVPALDVRARFGLPPRALDADQHLIVADAGPRLVALRVDRAVEVVEVSRAAVEEGRRVAPGSRLVDGVARLDDGLVVIHDLDRFLSLDEGARLDAALTARAGGRAEEGRRP